MALLARSPPSSRLVRRPAGGLILARRPPWPLLLVALASFAAVALPVGYLLYSAVGGPDRSSSTLEIWLAEWPRVSRSLQLVAGVLAVDLVLGVTLAWLTVRTNLWGRRLFVVLCVCPLAVPAYIAAYALLSVGGNNGVLVGLLGLDSPVLARLFAPEADGPLRVPRVSGYWGALVALAGYNLPYLFLPVRAALIPLDPALGEVARSLGRRRWQIGLRVILPQILPAVLAGSFLVALHVIADFGVVSLMRYDTLSASIYTRYQSFDTAGAARLALLVVALATLFAIFEMAILRRRRLDRAAFGTARRSEPTRLGFWQVPAIVLCLLVFAWTAALPALVAGYWMTRLDVTSQTVDQILRALTGSWTAGLPAAFCAAAVATPIAWLSARYPSRVGFVAERLPMVGYAVPGLAFGLSLILLCTAPWVPDPVYHAIYQSLPLLVFAYTFHFLAEAVGPIRSSALQTSPRLEEAARSLGRGRLATFAWVTFPLLRHGLIVAVVLVFLSCMKELPLTILLSPIGLETLAARAWDHTENAEFARAAPFALTILASSVGLVALLLWGDRRTP